MRALLPTVVLVPLIVTAATMSPSPIRAAQQATKHPNADPTSLGHLTFRAMFAIIHYARRMSQFLAHFHYPGFSRSGAALECTGCYAARSGAGYVWGKGHDSFHEEWSPRGSG